MPGFTAVHDQREIAAAGQLLPVYIRSFEIENYRCFRERQILNLEDAHGRPAQWTIILGDNNTGKSTLLECIALNFPVTDGSREVSDSSNEANGAIRLRISGGPMRRLFRLDPYRTSQFRFRSNLHVGPRTERASDKPYMVLEQKNIESLDKLFDGYKAKKSSVAVQMVGGPNSRATYVQEIYLGSAQRSKSYVSLLAGYGALRMGQGSESPSLSPPELSDNVASLFSPTAPLRNAEDWLLQVDYASRLNEAAPKCHRLNLVKKALLTLLPEVTDVKIVQPVSGALPRVQFQTQFGDFSLPQLSLGYQTVVRWLVDLAAKLMDHYPTADNFLEQPAVVLIDEIDLHLHPRWQRQIMGALSRTFPNTQFIASSHSPLVVQAAPDANTAVLVAEEAGICIRNEPQAVHGWRVDQILTSDLFGLDTARAPEIEPLLNQRRKIMTKHSLTSADRKKLRDIDVKIGTLSTGDTPEDMAAMDVIRRAAKRLDTKLSD